jgi:Polyketide cyclase / dehydrase and lipid transport
MAHMSGNLAHGPAEGPFRTLPQVAYSYVVKAHSGAAPEAVFSVLTRAATWPSWSPIDAAEVEGGADPDLPQQVGDVRVFRTGSAVSREPIVGLDPGRRFVYENLGGPFRSYRGVVELTPAAADGGTDITWTGTFTPKLPLTGRLWTWYLTRFMQRMVDGLAAYSVKES